MDSIVWPFLPHPEDHDDPHDRNADPHHPWTIPLGGIS